MQRRDAVATVAGLGAGGAVLLALVVVVGGDAVVGALGRAAPALAAAVAATILGWLCLWGVGFRAVATATGADIGLVDAVLVTAGAAFADHVTPFGQAGGEPATALLLSDVAGTPVERALATVTSFDALNVPPSLTFAAVGVGYYAAVAALDATLRAVAAGLAVVAVAAPPLVVLAWRRRESLERALVRAATPPARLAGRLLPRVDPPDRSAVAARVGGFRGAVESVAADRRRLAVALACSAAGWLSQVVGLWLALRAVGVAVPLYVPLFVVPLGTVGSALPTPGGLGGVEPIQVGLLTAATTATAASLTAAVLLFSVGGYLFTTSIGAAAVAVLQVRERTAA